MSEHRVSLAWEQAVAAEDFAKGRYSREHTWLFDGGVTIAGSSSPSVVPPPWSSAAAVDPEEAYVAAIASCHMLSFLYVAMKAGFAIARYRDEAVGRMSKNERGAYWVSHVELHPQIEFLGRAPSAGELAHLHHAAHGECFIANSVNTEITVAH